MLMDEIWKKALDFEGYEVSNFGRVRSYLKIGVRGDDRFADEPQRTLKPYVRPSDGRVCVTLRKDGESCLVFISRLVMQAFVGPRPKGMEVCHNDSDPMNNHLDNLRYDTRLENARDWVEDRCGLRTPERDADIRKRFTDGESAEMLGKEYGIGAHRIKFYICADIYRERLEEKRKQDNERARAMRYDRAAGMEYTEIAKKYNVCASTAGRICKGGSFKDAGGPIAPMEYHYRS